MQFVPNGPDIPNALLEAHEEGRVIFFCGAGISYSAGLPGFKGLVEDIYALNGTHWSETDVEHQAFTNKQYDTTLNHLERRLPGQRWDMRSALAKSLTPDLSREGATKTHEALLHLARDREGALRLVTTNFDRIFHAAAERTHQTFREYAAPLMPLPKKHSWDGLVYVHGLLSEEPSKTDLNNLVVTSGDFGRAYLTDGWASRFVNELFRHYVVCFIGYSIDDPVVRYMIDALAADRTLGETTPKAWVFAPCTPGEEKEKATEWKAKDITPILYHADFTSDDHSLLHTTLHAWGDTYRNGIMAKERIVTEYALRNPLNSTQHDNFVNRVLWALSDPSGLPAQRFADATPVPSLNWLEAITKEHDGPAFLKRFNAPPHNTAEYATSSLIMPDQSPEWDTIMPHLARWLGRHLDDPQLILWISKQGGHIHPRWANMIEFQLDEFARLERQDNSSELDSIRTHSPNAIPGPLMQTLWRLLLSGRVKTSQIYNDSFQWRRHLKRYGLTLSVRSELYDLLSPMVTLSPPFHRHLENEAPTHISEIVNWDLVLKTNSADTIKTLLNEDCNPKIFSDLLEDLQRVLCDAFELACEIGGPHNHYNDTSWKLPSIQPHPQNTQNYDWVLLIELVRDAWLKRLDINAAQASNIASAWFESPYPIFKRLALFAATHDHANLPSEQWVDWLLADNARWLWSSCTKREVLRLLVTQGHTVTSDAQKKLEQAIVCGPPKDISSPMSEDDNVASINSRSQWLRLAKLQSSGLSLTPESAQKLEELSRRYPYWRLAHNEKDEFSLWVSRSGDPDFEEQRDIDEAPRTRDGLIQWLQKETPTNRPLYEDTWRNVCQTRFYHCLCALSELAKKGIWPRSRWQQALQAWSNDALSKRSWRFAAPLIDTLPDTVLSDLVTRVSYWLKAASHSIDRHEEQMLSLCQRIMALSINEKSVVHHAPVTNAMNHPIGHITEALLNLWYQRGHPLRDGDLLPNDIKGQLTRLCNPSCTHFRPGRFVLFSYLTTLFRVDTPWTKKHMLPLLNWKKHPYDAEGAWKGFLYDPYPYPPLLIAFKQAFLDSVHHYDTLGIYGEQFATFLTYAALNRVDGYTVEDFRKALSALPQKGLDQAADAFSEAMNGQSQPPTNYWKNTAEPFWNTIWPKHRDRMSPNIASSLAIAAISTQNDFPAVLHAVRHWLQPTVNAHYIIDLLERSSLCETFPSDALELLSLVTVPQQGIDTALNTCLKAIAQAKPELEQDANYIKLQTYFR